MRLYKVTAILLCCLFVLHEICGLPLVPGSKRQTTGKPTSEAKEDLEKLRSLIISQDRGDINELADNLLKELRRRRLEKCIKQYGSVNICENRMAFYIWAQKGAKDIMSGN